MFRLRRPVSHRRRAFFCGASVVALALLSPAIFGADLVALDVRQFGAGDGDATGAIQSALNAAGSMAPCRVLAIDRQYLTDELTVPTGVQFEFNLKMLTPATPKSEKNGLRPKPGCRLIGRIEGNNITRTEVVERGIFPAVDGCHDVYLDVEVLGTTVAVQAHLNDLKNPPRRWSGKIVAKNIAAHLGGSNGYGLLGTLRDSQLQVFTTNVPRHGVYLVAGASNNDIEIHDQGGRFAPVDIAAAEGQPECVGNRIVAYVYGHRGDYPGLLCVGGVFIGGCRNNILTLHVSDCAPLHSAFRFLASTTKAYPRDNRVTVYFDGEITGNGVIECNSGTGNRVTVFGRGSSSGKPSSVVYVGRNDRITPSNPGKFAAVIDRIDFDCVSGFQHAVISAMNYAVTDLGNGVINARGYHGEAVNFYEFRDYVIGRV